MKLSNLLRKINTATRYAKQNGWVALVRLVMNYSFSKVSVTKRYDNYIGPAFSSSFDNASTLTPKTINWFLPPVGKGSGGHLNIFRFIKNLEDLGYENRIIIVDEPLPISAKIAKQEIEEWFFPLKAEVYVGATSDVPATYFAIATSWQTAYFVRRFQSCIQKCYFVQDYEPWFYPAGTDALLAEDTYRFGFYGLTAGDWLAQKLKTDFGMDAYAVGFSYDRDLYRPSHNKPIKSDHYTRVLFYARPPTARRAFELGMLVLREVCRQRNDVRVVLAGWDLSQYEIPFPYEHAGLVGLNDLAELYGICDVSLVLSCTNLSLLPLELMACGVPVVSNKAPHTEWLLSDENAMLAESNIQSLTQAVLRVIESPDLANRLREAGLAFAESTSWEQEAGKLAAQLNYLSNL